jgi:clan AA aspartic protease (TIGR02281 family)
LFIMVATLGARSEAQTYKWTDDSGVASYTDDPTSIPSSHRSKAVEVNGKIEPSGMDDAGGGGEVPKAAVAQAAAKKEVLWVAPLKSRGFSYCVDAEVNRGARLNMLVDTGASFTILTVEAAKRLGFTNLDALPKMPVSTAGGVTWIHLVELESVKVGGAEAVSIEGGVSNQIGDGLDGLLGMSFLGEFVYQLDGLGGQLTLKSARGLDTKGGGDKGWWLTRYNHYVENIHRFTAYKESLETGAPLDDPELKKTRGFTREDVGKVIAYYTGLLNSLDRRASAVGVPREWRVYP